MEGFVGASFAVVGLASILFGIVFVARKKARIFYGFNVEGTVAVVVGILLIVIGAILAYYGIVKVPEMLGPILEN